MQSNKRITPAKTVANDNLTQLPKTKQVVAHTVNASSGGGVRVVHHPDNSFTRLAKALNVLGDTVETVVQAVDTTDEEPQVVEQPPEIAAADRAAGTIEGLRVKSILHEMALGGAGAEEREAALAQEIGGLGAEDQNLTETLLPQVIEGVEQADRIEQQQQLEAVNEGNVSLLRGNLDAIFSMSGSGYTGDLGENFSEDKTGLPEINYALENALQMKIADGSIGDTMISALDNELNNRIAGGNIEEAEDLIEALRFEQHDNLHISEELSGRLDKVFVEAEDYIYQLDMAELQEEEAQELVHRNERIETIVQRCSVLDDKKDLLRVLVSEESAVTDSDFAEAEKKFNVSMLKTTLAELTGKEDSTLAAKKTEILESVSKNRDSYDKEDLRLLLLSGSISPATYREVVDIIDQDIAEVNNVGDFIGLLQRNHGYSPIVTDKDCELFEEEYQRLTGGKPVETDALTSLITSDRKLRSIKTEEERSNYRRDQSRPEFRSISNVIKSKPAMLYRLPSEQQQSYAADYIRNKRIQAYNEELNK